MVDEAERLQLRGIVLTHCAAIPLCNVANGYNSEVENHSRRVRSTPINRRRQTGSTGPFHAKERTRFAGARCLAAFGRRPLVYVAPISLAGIRNPQHNRTHAPQQIRRNSIVSDCKIVRANLNPCSSLPRFGATASHHRNGDASQVDREPRTQLGAAKHQDNPIAVSQPCEAYPSHDGTTNSDRSIVAS